jgi:hypothetical protein
VSHAIINLSAILDFFKNSFSMLFMKYISLLVFEVSIDLLHIWVSYCKFCFGGHLEYLRLFEFFGHLTKHFWHFMVQATKIYHEISSNYNSVRNDKWQFKPLLILENTLSPIFLIRFLKKLKRNFKLLTTLFKKPESLQWNLIWSKMYSNIYLQNTSNKCECLCWVLFVELCNFLKMIHSLKSIYLWVRVDWFFCWTKLEIF